MLSESNPNQKMLFRRRGLNIAREKLRLPDTTSAWDNDFGWKSSKLDSNFGDLRLRYA